MGINYDDDKPQKTFCLLGFSYHQVDQVDQDDESDEDHQGDEGDEDGYEDEDPAKRQNFRDTPKRYFPLY